MAREPKAREREREGGGETGEVERDDMLQAGTETMSCPQYSFFSTSTIMESWGAHVRLAKDYISQASFRLGVPCDQVLDKEDGSRSGKGNFWPLGILLL